MKPKVEIEEQIYLDTDSSEDFVSIEEHSTSDDIELSLAEEVFDTLQIYKDTFKPTFFSDGDLGNLSQTSYTMHEVISPELEKRKAAKKLLTHVVRGEQEEAERMIAVNPALLTIKSKAKDYSGRTIIATAFQAALGAEDERMWEMMLPYFDELAEGEALRQCDLQFPNGFDDQPASELEHIYNDLVEAIIEGRGIDAIESFREMIIQQGTVHQGKHFNMQHLIAACQVYNRRFFNLGNWNNRDMFWQKVIGFVQRQMSANYAQAHCSGLKSVNDDSLKFRRTFDFDNRDAIKFFPLDDNVDFRLGFDFGVYSFREACGWLTCSRSAVVCLQKLSRTKTDSLSELRARLESGFSYEPTRFL